MTKALLKNLCARRFADLTHIVGFTTLLLGLMSCSRPETVGIELKAVPASDHDPRHLTVHAEVHGAQGTLSYHWFSQSGECAPQRSDIPSTVYAFGEGRTRDRVVLEVWQGDRRLAQSDLAVTAIEPLTVSAAKRIKPNVQIEMTDTPPYDPIGGFTTRAHIGGKLTGELESPMIVVLYTKTNTSWFVQSPDNSKHVLRSDHSFSTWVNTGMHYAILITRPSFSPSRILETLPLSDNDVLASLVIEGEKP